MRNILMAGVMLAAMMGTAMAGGEYHPPENNGGTTHVTQTNNQNVWTHQNQSQSQYQNATGGAGGNGGAGGTAYGGNSTSTNSNTNTATGGNATATGGNASSSSSSSSNSNSGGNTQNVNQNETLQAPAVSSFIAASGPCTGVSGGAAISLAGFGLGASFASLEADCQKRELLRIGFSSGNASVESQAALGWQQMYSAAFGSSSSSQQTGAIGSAPAAIAPQQTASAGNPACVGMNTKTNWYANNCPAQ